MMSPPSAKRSLRPVLAVALAALPFAALVHIGCGGSDQPLGNMPPGDDTIDAGGGIDCTNGPNFTDCPCTAGETKACYTGPAATRGVGACKDGVQTCAEHQELHYSFGACAGETLPTATETCVTSDPCPPGGCDPGVLAPRPIAPTSTGKVTSWLPTLQWKLAANTDGAHVWLCHDRACSSIIEEIDAPGASVKPTKALSPGIVYWKVAGTSGGKRGATTGPVWEFFVGKNNAPHDTSWGTIFDVNGDGYADLFMTDLGSQFPSEPSNKAQLFVYLGGPDGLPATPSQTIAGPPGNYFDLGMSLASAGDVNGDGYADALVGTWGGTTSTVGFASDLVFIYLGGPNGLAASPATTLLGLYGGKGDPVAGNCPAPGSKGCDFFGGLVGPAGDVDLDGYADVAVAAQIPSPSGSSSNYIYVYGGTPTGVSTTATATLGGPGSNISLMENMYQYLGPIGPSDVNGDGYADLVASGTVFMGGPGGISTTPVVLTFGPTGSTDPTKGVASYPGDFDGDGYTDVMLVNGLCIFQAGGACIEYVFKGGPAGIATTPSLMTTHVWPANQNGGLNWSSGAVADLNGDGYADAVMGSNWSSLSPSSKISLGFSPGSAAGLAVAPTLITPALDTATKGPVVYSVGDVNGDGYEDTATVIAAASGDAHHLNVVYGSATWTGASAKTIALPASLSSFHLPIGGAAGGI